MSKVIQQLLRLAVSSHAMRSTSFRTRSARSVMSSRLPIGVATDKGRARGTMIIPGSGDEAPALRQQAHGVHQVLQVTMPTMRSPSVTGTRESPRPGKRLIVVPASPPVCHVEAARHHACT